MAENLPWFRLYHEIVDDDKIRLLAFEDRWHYIAILCCKRKGILDDDQSTDMLHRRLSVRLGLQVRELEELKRRLVEVGLVDSEWQPTAWTERQKLSDGDSTAAERKRRQRERASQTAESNVTDVSRVTNCDSHGEVTRLEESRLDKSRESASESRTDTKGSTNNQFAPPTVDDVRQYITERESNVDAQRFVDFYASKGWMVGRNKMKDWRAAVRTWEGKTEQETPKRTRKKYPS